MKKRLTALLTLVFLIVPVSESDLAVRAVEEATPPAELAAPTLSPDVSTGAPPEYLYPGLLPDHPLYILKDLYYRLRTRLVFGTANQANWYLKLADKRAAEARDLAKKGKFKLATRASQKATEMYALAVERIEKLGRETPTELVERFKKVNLRQKVVLEEVLERLSPEVKPVLDEALKSSKEGLDSALKAVGEKLSEPASPLETIPPAESKIDDSLLAEVEADPDQTYMVQVRLGESITEDDKLELEELMEVEIYTEKQAIGEATGESLLEIADLPYVSRIALLPEASPPEEEEE